MIRSPFTYGMVCSAPVIGALAGGSALNARGTILFALAMAVGAAVAVLACSWWPKLSAPVWKLWPASVAANPLFLLAAGYRSITTSACWAAPRAGIAFLST